MSTIKFFVRLNSNPLSNPYYIFSNNSGGVALNSTSQKLDLIKGNTYIFERSDSGHPFNIGDNYKQNNTGISINSTSGSDEVNGAGSIQNTQTLTFTIPNNYSGILKYYCFIHSSMIQSFNIINPPQAAPGLILVDGVVPNWMQPNYLEVSQNLIVPSGIVNNPGIHGFIGIHPGMPNENFKAWCSPTSAACQLGHLDNHGIFPPGTLSLPLGQDPNGFGDSLDAGVDKPFAIQTIAWDAGAYFADNLLDGPIHRLPVGLMNSNNVSDFGWHMNTNNLGRLGLSVPPMKGTKIQYIYEGLDNFYGTVGIKDMVALTYHSTNNNTNPVPPSCGRYYPQYWINQGYTDGTGANYDITATLNTIEYEISYNRSVMACTKGWALDIIPDKYVNLDNTPEEESNGQIYKFKNAGNNNETTDEEYIEHEHNPENPEGISQSLGHTVLIIGLIKYDSSANPYKGQTPATNLLIVRDNQPNTTRNVVVPFDNSLGGVGGSMWENLLATIYVNPMLNDNSGSPPGLLANYWNFGTTVSPPQNSASAAASNAATFGVNKGTITIAEELIIPASNNDIINFNADIKNIIINAPNPFTRRQRRHSIIDMIFANSNNSSKNEFKTKTEDLNLITSRSGVTTKTNVKVFKKDQTINLNNTLTSDIAVYANLDTSGDSVTFQNSQSETVTITQNISGSYDVTGEHTGVYHDGSMALIIGYNMEFGGVFINGEDSGESNSGGSNTGGSASSNGDPHIYPLYGSAYELPIKVSAYRMLQGKKLIMNASTRAIRPEERKEILSDFRMRIGKEPPKNLVTDGVFYNKIFVESDGNSFTYDFDTEISDVNEKSDYFYIKYKKPDIQEFSKDIQYGTVLRKVVEFSHSIYGSININLDYFSAPQTKYGIGITVNNSTGLSGLLICEYKCKLMECYKLKNNKFINSKHKIGINKSRMKYISKF